MEKLYTSKTFLKMAGGRTPTPHRTSLDPLVAISYGNCQKSSAYFSHLTPLVLFFFTEKQSQKGEGMAQWLFPKYAFVCWAKAADLGMLGALDTAGLGFCRARVQALLHKKF